MRIDLRLFAACLAICSLPAQDVTIRTRASLVVAPTTVTDAQGKFVDGLGEQDFVLLDNGAPRPLRMDTSDVAMTPISLVIVVQANRDAAPAIAKIRKVGAIVEPLITGERGEAAVLRVTDSIDLIQDFTNDGSKISTAFRQLKAGGEEAPIADASARAIEMLRERGEHRRKVILLFSESRDRGSETKLRDLLQLAQRENVTIYPVTFSVHATAWTSKPEDAPPAPGGFDPIKAIAEIARMGKVNTADELARFTGGRRLSFATLRGLERDLARVGEELHSQYLLSFVPPQENAGAEFHAIEVRVKNRPGLVIHTRPGYWSVP